MAVGTPMPRCACSQGRQPVGKVNHVHEELQLPKDIAVHHLPGDLLHYSYPTVQVHTKNASSATAICMPANCSPKANDPGY
jgi:hypothetical protein